jgi:hypothetical protein
VRREKRAHGKWLPIKEIIKEKRGIHRFDEREIQRDVEKLGRERHVGRKESLNECVKERQDEEPYIRQKHVDVRKTMGVFLL